MRQRFVFLVVVCACLALAVTPLMADRDRSADRTKAAERGMTFDENRTAIHPVVRRTPLQFRAHEVQIGLSSAHSASRFLAAADQAQNRDEEVAMLWMVTRYATDDKLLAVAYERLGGLYEGAPHKQVHSYALAMQYTASPIARERLAFLIVELGGNPVEAALTNNNNSQSAQHGCWWGGCGPPPAPDACAWIESINVPWWETMDISPVGSRVFRQFDIPPGPEGWDVKIETFANPDDPWGDTVLWLWGGCGDDGPEGLIAFNDDKNTAGGDYMSLIEVACMLPGTYYIEVGGYNDFVEVLDFEFTVEQTGTCVIPEPDYYEPDDDRAEASRIGTPTSIWFQIFGWSWHFFEIQSHSFFPHYDIDHVKFQPWRNEMVRMSTALQFGTFCNDYEEIPIGTSADTYIELLYGNEPDYGGFCNDPAAGYTPYCRVAEDCPPPIGEPSPDFPTCIPIYFFTFGGSRVFYPENPLAYNYDIGPGQWGSELLECLPRSDRWQEDSLSASGGWILRLMSNPIWYPAGMYDYQVQVKNQYTCDFENEPNNGPDGAQEFVFGEVYYGFQDYSAFFGNGGNDPQGSPWFRTDPDWYAFDVDDQPWAETVVSISTDSFSPYSDTGLVLYVGPDDDGFYYDTGIDDDDGGVGFLSNLEFVAIPANDLLGNVVNDADYFVDVTSFWLGTNYGYSVSGFTREYIPPLPPLEETEPNETCASANPFDISQPVLAAINPVCDFDAFTFTLTEDTAMVLETAGGDTAMLLEWTDGTFVACDDDSATTTVYASRIETCLPPGDYCARTRPWSSGVAPFAYELVVTNMGSCVPTDPPTSVADGLMNCANDGATFDNGYGCVNP